MNEHYDLIKFFKEYGIYDYRITFNDIKKRITILSESAEHNKNEKLRFVYVLFNYSDVSYYLRTNVINQDFVDYIKHIVSSHTLQSSKYLELSIFKSISSNKKFADNTNFYRFDNHFKNIHITSLYHSIKVISSELSSIQTDYNTFTYVQLLDNKNNYIFSNATERPRSIEELSVLSWNPKKKIDVNLFPQKLRIRFSYPVIMIIVSLLTDTFNTKFFSYGSSYLIRNKNERILDSSVNILNIGDYYLHYDAEGNSASKSYLIKNGMIDSLLCSQISKSNYTKNFTYSSYFNYNLNDFDIFSPKRELKFEGINNSDLNDYDFYLKYTVPESIKYSLETGNIRCIFMCDSEQYLEYYGPLTILLSQIISSETLGTNYEDYILREYIAYIPKENFI